jgi:hypothetical protein
MDSPEKRLVEHRPVIGETVNFDKLQQEERLHRIEETLGTLIAWLLPVLGSAAMNELHRMLKEPE